MKINYRCPKCKNEDIVPAIDGLGVKHDDIGFCSQCGYSNYLEGSIYGLGFVPSQEEIKQQVMGERI